MNNSRTPKIVVGVGLAAVYAAGFSFYMLRGANADAVAPITTTPPVASIASAPEPLPSIAPPLAEAPVEAASQAPAEPAASDIDRASVRRSEPVRAEQPVKPPAEVPAPAPAAAVVADGGSDIERADGAAALIGEDPVDSGAVVTSSDEEGSDEPVTADTEGSAEIEQQAMPAAPNDSVDPGDL